MTPEKITQFTDQKLGMTFSIEPPVPVPAGGDVHSIGDLFGFAVCDSRREPLYGSTQCGRRLDRLVGSMHALGNIAGVNEMVASAFLVNGGRRRVTSQPVAAAEQAA